MISVCTLGNGTLVPRHSKEVSAVLAHREWDAGPVCLIIPPSGFLMDDRVFMTLGILRIAAVLEESGADVEVLDLSGISNYEEAVEDHCRNTRAVNFGITATTDNRFRAIKTIQMIKARRPDIFVFVGGRHFHHTAESALKNIKEIDIVVRGEGELASQELLDKHFSGESTDNVENIVYRKGNLTVVNPLRPLIKDLDSLPFPAWHLFKLDRYNATLEGIENGPRSIGVISSRGCPNLCIFCANASFWNVLRLRSPKNFVDEIETLHKNYGYRAFNFWDDTMTMVPRHILGICEEIIARKLDIIWYARARVNTVNENILKKMKEAGCKVISFGVESGSPRILKKIKKNISTEQILKAYDLSLGLGFNTKAFFMESFPGETLEDIKMTNDLKIKLLMIGMRHLKPVYIADVNNCTLIYPGTEMENIAQKEGLLPDGFDWNKPTPLPLNEKLGFKPHVPVYESPDLPIKRILEFNVNYNKRFNVLFKKFIYHLILIRSFGNLESFARFCFNIFKKQLYGGR